MGEPLPTAALRAMLIDAGVGLDFVPVADDVLRRLRGRAEAEVRTTTEANRYIKNSAAGIQKRAEEATRKIVELIDTQLTELNAGAGGAVGA